MLIVLNEKFNYKKYVPDDILSSFESIKDVHTVNLADNRGLEGLQLLIQQHMRTLPHIGKEPIPKKWVAIRRVLEDKEDDYISHEEYLSICYQNGIKDKKQAQRISEFLHDLGVILHFQKDLLLRNTVILNTNWATEAVYLILFDSTVIKNNGEFDQAELDRIWGTPEYNGKQADLLQLMINFELCYQIKDSHKYIVPQLLPEKPKEYEWSSKNNLFFEYRYTFMPKGIISRLIVRMNRYIHEQIQWKNGVVLQIEETKIEIKEDFFRRILKIRVSGERKAECLTIIRKEVTELHETFKKDIEDFVSEMIPCVCSKCKSSNSPHFYNYQLLRKYEAKNRPTIVCENSFEDVVIRALISGITIQESNDGNIKGILFEYIIEKLLRQIFPNTTIEHGKLLKGEKDGKKQKYEYDFIVTDSLRKEVVIIEVKGYHNKKHIALGDHNTKETVQWFFGRTFPFAKKILIVPDGYSMKACYITWANFADSADNFLQNLNSSRLKSTQLDVYYDHSKLITLFQNYGLNNDVKELSKHFNK